MITYPIVYVRWCAGQPRIVRYPTPLGNEHPLIGRACLACGQPLRLGSVVAGVVVGGDDDREGRWHAAPAIVVHDRCAWALPVDDALVALARQERGCAPFEESVDAGAHAHVLEPQMSADGAEVLHTDPDTGQTAREVI